MRAGGGGGGGSVLILDVGVFVGWGEVEAGVVDDIADGLHHVGVVCSGSRVRMGMR